VSHVDHTGNPSFMNPGVASLIAGVLVMALKTMRIAG
jgi:hypothetical protein